MAFLLKSSWRYALLLVVLFAIVAWASHSIIATLERHIRDPIYDRTLSGVSMSIWALTMGCLFMAGALGLWGIQSSVDIESRRRIGRLVDAMDYLNDGLVMIERDGVISGANPAAKSLSGQPDFELGRQMFRDAFPDLTENDLRLIMNPGRTCEIERDSHSSNGMRVLRFRSQHSQGMRLVLISDVTAMKSLEIRKKQMAQLQMAGRIAAGVAHDFNNILCAVSAHAALLKRVENNPSAAKSSLDVIMRETDRGSRLSRQLLELSRTGVSDKPCEKLEKHVEEAAGLLKIALSPDWTVKTMIEGKYPPVPLSSAQVEQVVLNLGILAADSQASPGTMTVALSNVGKGHLAAVGDMFAAVIIISAEAGRGEASPIRQDALYDNRLPLDGDESGVIPSVVSSIVSEVGGRMDSMTTGPNGLCIYRVALPSFASSSSIEEWIAEISGVKALFDSKVIFFACPANKAEDIGDLLAYCGATLDRKTDMLDIFAAAENNPKIDGFLIHDSLFAANRDGLLKALKKLCPSTGIVVLAQDKDARPADLDKSILVEPENSSPDRIALRLAEAMTANAV